MEEHIFTMNTGYISRETEMSFSTDRQQNFKIQFSWIRF